MTTHSLSILEKYQLIDEVSSRKATINNNEAYEKLRPLKIITKELAEDQAHGDDTHIEIPLELFSYEYQQKSHLLQKQSAFESKLNDQQIHFIEHVDASVSKTNSPISSSSDEFSLEMAVPTNNHLLSNEELKTDDENGMTKSYFISDYNQITNEKEKNLILSDVSLQQHSSNDQCEYEIDLGNGWITKSLSSYQSDDKQQQQQRTNSIISADSIQPTTIFKIPFTNTFYKQRLHENPIERNILFNAHDYIQPRWPQISLKSITVLSIGTTIIGLLIIVMFFVF